MRGLLPIVLLAAAACHRPSPCERFAKMEVKCNAVGKFERDKSLAIARGMCEAAGSKDPNVAEAGAQFAKEAECAAQTDDCDKYKKCRDQVDGLAPAAAQH